jgi:hypothetical protein
MERLSSGERGAVCILKRGVEVESATGKELNRFQIERIEINQRLDASMFKPPHIRLTPLQVAMDQIFQERDDADAVQWTYHDFRNAYPDTNTEEAMEVIGNQSLKMGSIASAVALLEHNRYDYPRSAAAAFGLGRAYKTAGRIPMRRRNSSARCRLIRNISVRGTPWRISQPADEVSRCLEETRAELETPWCEHSPARPGRERVSLNSARLVDPMRQMPFFWTRPLGIMPWKPKWHCPACHPSGATPPQWCAFCGRRKGTVSVQPFAPLRIPPTPFWAAHLAIFATLF